MKKSRNHKLLSLTGLTTLVTVTVLLSAVFIPVAVLAEPAKKAVKDKRGV